MKDMMRAVLENITDVTEVQAIDTLSLHVLEKKDNTEIETMDNMVNSLDNLDNALEMLEHKEDVSSSEVYLAQVALESISLTVGVNADVSFALESIENNKDKVKHMRSVVEGRTLRTLKAATEAIGQNDRHELRYEFDKFAKSISKLVIDKDATLVIEHHGVHDFLTINNKHVNTFKDLGKDDVSFMTTAVVESKAILKELQAIKANTYAGMFADISHVTGRKGMDKLTRFKLLNNGYTVTNESGLDIDYMSVANDGSTASFLKKLGYGVVSAIPGALVGAAVGGGVGAAIALPLIGVSVIAANKAADYSERGKNTSTLVGKADIEAFFKTCLTIGDLAQQLADIDEEISSELDRIHTTLQTLALQNDSGGTVDRVLDIGLAVLKANQRTKSIGEAGKSNVDRVREELTLFMYNKSVTLISIPNCGVYHAWLFANAATGIAKALGAK